MNRADLRLCVGVLGGWLVGWFGSARRCDGAAEGGGSQRQGCRHGTRGQQGQAHGTSRLEGISTKLSTIIITTLTVSSARPHGYSTKLHTVQCWRAATVPLLPVAAVACRCQQWPSLCLAAQAPAVPSRRVCYRSEGGGT